MVMVDSPGKHASKKQLMINGYSIEGLVFIEREIQM